MKCPFARSWKFVKMSELNRVKVIKRNLGYSCGGHGMNSCWKRSRSAVLSLKTQSNNINIKSNPNFK